MHECPVSDRMAAQLILACWFAREGTWDKFLPVNRQEIEEKEHSMSNNLHPSREYLERERQWLSIIKDINLVRDRLDDIAWQVEVASARYGQSSPQCRPLREWQTMYEEAINRLV